jgi:hypothetical protein
MKMQLAAGLITGGNEKAPQSLIFVHQILKYNY